MRSLLKKCIPILLAASLCLTAGGCTSFLEGEYRSAQRYVDDLPVHEGSEVIVRSYAALRSAVLSLVEAGEPEGKLSFSGYSGEPDEDLPRVCSELKSSDALCAYAVDYFSYDLSRIVSYYEARVFVNFRRSAEEIDRIRNVGAVSRVPDALFGAMQAAETSLVVQAAGEPEISTADLQDIAQQYYYSAPLDCLQLPYVSLRVYPGTGIYRIYEIGIDYGSADPSRTVLAEQLSTAALTLSAAIRAENEAAGGDGAALAALTAQRLAEHSAWVQSVSGYDLTAFGALVGSRASDEGLAMAFKALCDLLGLDCLVIAGRMDKAPHVWNMVRCTDEPDAQYLHVDVSQLLIDAEADNPAGLRGEGEMWGRYWWDIDRYPFYGETAAVFGPPSDAAGEDAPVPPEEEEGSETGEGDEPEGSGRSDAPEQPDGGENPPDGASGA